MLHHIRNNYSWLLLLHHWSTNYTPCNEGAVGIMFLTGLSDCLSIITILWKQLLRNRLTDFIHICRCAYLTVILIQQIFWELWDFEHISYVQNFSETAEQISFIFGGIVCDAMQMCILHCHWDLTKCFRVNRA